MPAAVDCRKSEAPQRRRCVPVAFSFISIFPSEAGPIPVVGIIVQANTANLGLLGQLRDRSYDWSTTILRLEDRAGARLLISLRRFLAYKTVSQAPTKSDARSHHPPLPADPFRVLHRATDLIDLELNTVSKKANHQNFNRYSFPLPLPSKATLLPLKQKPLRRTLKKFISVSVNGQSPSLELELEPEVTPEFPAGHD
ncbi:hypothetical protein L218DRAFT_951648 [Marasmius fiardii PR-910]|nr:hypothetical protein L218DRAFT_951648 [Marasmius fiardii PR-910]